MNSITLARLRSFGLDWEGRPNLKHILIRDIERCPFAPKDTQYDEWMKKDDARLERLTKARANLLDKTNSYLSHSDRVVREMAIFINWFLSGDE